MPYKLFNDMSAIFLDPTLLKPKRDICIILKRDLIGGLLLLPPRSFVLFSRTPFAHIKAN